jgi:anti-sigma regulatory factor (Ser/Thr protein kinase)
MGRADPAGRLAVMAADWFPGTPEAVGQARRFVAGVLGGDCPGLDDVLLMVSEIAANAVLHTASGAPGGWLDLTISVSAAGDVIRVTVTDQGSISEPRLCRDGVHPGELDGGRGLSLVSVLADRWGYTGDWRGRVVWFELSPGARP